MARKLVDTGATETKLPDTIVGGLPSPEKIHRIVMSNETVDGIVHVCSCGFQTVFAHDPVTANALYDQHVRG
jgi:predicted aspartyl protease